MVYKALWAGLRVVQKDWQHGLKLHQNFRPYFLFAVPDLKILFLAQKLNELEDFKENHRNLLNKSIDASK